jgi:hypothetical protein
LAHAIAAMEVEAWPVVEAKNNSRAGFFVALVVA